MRLLLLLFLSALPAFGQTSAINSQGWQKIRACGVRFRLPTQMRAVKVYPVDSCLKRYRSDALDLDMDVIYSPHTPRGENHFRNFGSDKPDFQVREVTIGGVRSLIKSYYTSGPSAGRPGLPYVSALLVPSIGKDRRGLMMRVHSKTPDGTHLSRIIFQSLK